MNALFYDKYDSTPDLLSKLISAKVFLAGSGNYVINLTQKVIISSGNSQAFYFITNGNVRYGYSMAGETGRACIIVQNNDITVTSGTSSESLFGYILYPRFFNGAISYDKYLLVGQRTWSL